MCRLFYKWWNTFMLATGLESRKDSDEDLDVKPSTTSNSVRRLIEDYKLLDWGDTGLFYEYLEMGKLLKNCILINVTKI